MIEVRYKCTCMTGEVPVRLPYRPSAVDVVSWLQGPVARAVSEDHRRRSPLCQSSVMEYVKVPMPENAPHLGGKPELQS